MPIESFNCEIITPEGVFLNCQATLVELPTIGGQIGVMAGHQPLATALEIGALTVHRNGHAQQYLIGGGFAQIRPARLSVTAICVHERMDEGVVWECRKHIQEMLGDSYTPTEIDAACDRALSASPGGRS